MIITVVIMDQQQVLARVQVIAEGRPEAQDLVDGRMGHG